MSRAIAEKVQVASGSDLISLVTGISVIGSLNAGSGTAQDMQEFEEAVILSYGYVGTFNDPGDSANLRIRVRTSNRPTTGASTAEELDLTLPLEEGVPLLHIHHFSRKDPVRERYIRPRATLDYDGVEILQTPPKPLEMVVWSVVLRMKPTRTSVDDNPNVVYA